MTNYCSIGKLVATFGVKGEMILRHHLGKKTSLKGVEVFFIEDKKDAFLPYFIEEIRLKNEEEVYLRIDGVQSKEQARPFLQKQVWLTEDDFHKQAGRSAPISLLGFHIVNEGLDLGEILEVIEQPQQLLCRIEWRGKEALIPLHEASLQKIDQKKKQVLVKLPEGLLDVFG